MPHSKCNDFWLPVLKLFSGIEEPETLKKLLHGYCRGDSKDRAENSGIIFQAWNHIVLQGQSEFLHNHPRVIFIPFKFAGWPSGMKCIVIADDPYVFSSIGANHPSCQIMTERLDSGEVQTAFEQFRKYSLTIVNYMRRVKEVRSDTCSKLCESLYRFLEDQEELALPYIEDDLLAVPDLCFRVVEFEAAVIKTPERSFEDLRANPAPCPFFLILQSLNAWFTALYHMKCRGSVEHLRLVNDNITDKSRVSCVLFPECQDDCDKPNCTFCLAKKLLSNPHSKFTTEDYENLRDAAFGLKGEEAFNSDLLREVIGDCFSTASLQISETAISTNTKDSVSELLKAVIGDCLSTGSLHITVTTVCTVTKESQLSLAPVNPSFGPVLVDFLPPPGGSGWSSSDSSPKSLQESSEAGSNEQYL